MKETKNTYEEIEIQILFVSDADVFTTSDDDDWSSWY